jgi:LysM repeat protein
MKSADLRALNDMTGDTVRTGQKLKVRPASSRATSSASAPVEEPQEEPQIQAQAPPQAPARTPSSDSADASGPVGLYTVERGDTLSKIAARHGMKSADLRALNDMTGDTVRTGQKLKVRGGSPETPQVAPDRPEPDTRTAQAPAEREPRETPAASGTGVYTVQSGDTLSQIAERHGMRSAELRALNDMTGDTVRVGQKLKVQGGSAAPAQAPSASSGASASSGSSGASGSGSGVYTVQSGDTVSRIAEKHGMRSADLRSLNNLSGDGIRVGQKLKVSGAARASDSPDSGASPAPARTPAPAAPAPAAAPARAPAPAQAPASAPPPTPRLAPGEIPLTGGPPAAETQVTLSGGQRTVTGVLNVPPSGSGQAPPAAAPPSRPASSSGSGSGQSSSSGSGSGTYTVQSGDTVSQIAEKHGMKSSELRSLNNLSGDGIRVGQKLKVTGAARSGGSSSSGSGSSGSGASSGASSYKVKDGDSMYSIARRHGLTVDDLRRLNSRSGDIVRPGETLKVK